MNTALGWKPSTLLLALAGKCITSVSGGAAAAYGWMVADPRAVSGLAGELARPPPARNQVSGRAGVSDFPLAGHAVQRQEGIPTFLRLPDIGILRRKGMTSRHSCSVDTRTRGSITGDSPAGVP